MTTELRQEDAFSVSVRTVVEIELLQIDAVQSLVTVRGSWVVCEPHGNVLVWSIVIVVSKCGLLVAHGDVKVDTIADFCISSVFQKR